MVAFRWVLYPGRPNHPYRAGDEPAHLKYDVDWQEEDDGVVEHLGAGRKPSAQSRVDVVKLGRNSTNL